jgi:capsular polysaccharide biosynthesis protein
MTVQWRTGDTGIDLRGIEDEFFDAEPSASYPPATLVTVRFLWDAIRRHTRVWIVAALIGLTAGLTFPVLVPPASESSVTLLLTHREGDDPARSIVTDVSVLESLQVAQLTLAELTLDESPFDLQKRYTVEQLTDRIVEISARAETSPDATRLAATLAEVFLEFRGEQIALQAEPLQAMSRLDL